MDIYKIISQAVDLVETHLDDEELDISFLAKRLYVSPFYFQRIFKALVGKPIGTYIRERRLTEAGTEIKLGASVLDVTLKYGYDSQEAFTRAFRQFHGMSPGAAKKGVILSCCPPVNTDHLIKGGMKMDIKIEKENAFEIAVLTQPFQGETANAEIPRFWDAYYEKGYHQSVPPMLGVCLSDGSEFDYGIGSLKDYCMDIPEGFQILSVPAALWGKFYTTGAIPDAIQKLWPEVYKWIAFSDYEIVPGFDFECYSEGDTTKDDYVSGIWIALKHK